MITFKHVLNGAAAALGAALALTACGQAPGQAPSGADSAEQEQHNEADVEFARMMIPHHEQAVEMADLAEDRAGDEVGELSEEIRGAQGPEIEQMQQMLQDWGADSGEDMDHSGMEGMLSDEQMEELAASEGEEFDTLFLELMIEHHEGAVDMAGTVLEEGTAPEAQQLAEEIEQAQQEEIEQMQTMLGKEPSGEDSDENHGTGDDGDEGH
ncbi:DUF305 domain-containing protein [Nocardiopsis xinjiangensis]|uniref:DUF305 domain-containing protein n=1 Tax=Nocardiopsis xinjiangensis TaxID=124285 RepID=UPI000345EAB9|nr:DUF305 domain-containing protein [Nocardiopsis xinjiangensis]